MSLQKAPGQELFDALADPTRRSIIGLLASNGEMAASEIYRNFEMSNPAVSQHLRILRDAELVRVEKDAQKHLYSLNADKMRDLQDWVKETTDLWSERFDKLDRLLEAEKRKVRKRR